MSFESFDEADEPNTLSAGDKPGRRDRIASLFRLLSEMRLRSLNRRRYEAARDAVLDPAAIRLLLGVVASRHMDAGKYEQLPPEVQAAASSYIDRMYDVLDLDHQKARQDRVVTPARALGYVMMTARKAISEQDMLVRQAEVIDNEAARAVEPVYEQAMQRVNEMLADAFDGHAAGRSSGTISLDGDKLPPGLL